MRLPAETPHRGPSVGEPELLAVTRLRRRAMTAAEAKIARLGAALTHQEGDRVPVSDFFWTGFVNRCRTKWGEGFDPYRHFDLDYVVVNPNMDPRIQPFEVIAEDGEDIVLKTGFGATIRRSGDKPMPYYEAFSVSEPEEMADFAFDPPEDRRRFFEGGDDQINGVGDALVRDLPPWDERVAGYVADFAVFGSVCEPFEYLWRCIGSENALLWMASARDALAAFVDRVGAFIVSLAEAQIAAGGGRLSGMYLWGDVAYRNAMLFSPALWRELLKPHVKALASLCHRHGLMVIYHGCGNSREILGDLAEIGVDGYNPVEVKAGLDAVELKQTYGGKLAFVGNIDVRVLEAGDPEVIRREVLYKLRAARGGGWVCQSDHSVSSAVSPESYELALNTLREFGRYPLAL
jgi:uroporphyrinogen decarboxylase